MSIILNVLEGVELLFVAFQKLAILIPILIVLGVARVLYRDRHSSAGIKRQAPVASSQTNAPEPLEKSKKLGVLYAELGAAVNMNTRIRKLAEEASKAGEFQTNHEVAYAQKWMAEQKRIEGLIAQAEERPFNASNSQSGA